MAQNILYESFDTVTAPALPTQGWEVWSANFATTTDWQESGANSLTYIGGPATEDWERNSQRDGVVGPQGEALVSAYIRFPSAPAAPENWSEARLAIRWLTNNNRYYVALQPSNVLGGTPGITLYRITGGGVTTTSLGTRGPSQFVTGETYFVEITTSGNNITVAVQRVLNGDWLDAFNVWQTYHTHCHTTIDSTIIGQGFCGVGFADGGGGGPFIDSFRFANTKGLDEPLTGSRKKWLRRTNRRPKHQSRKRRPVYPRAVLFADPGLRRRPKRRFQPETIRVRDRSIRPPLLPEPPVIPPTVAVTIRPRRLFLTTKIKVTTWPRQIVAPRFPTPPPQMPTALIHAPKRGFKGLGNIRISQKNQKRMLPVFQALPASWFVPLWKKARRRTLRPSIRVKKRPVTQLLSPFPVGLYRVRLDRRFRGLQIVRWKTWRPEVIPQYHPSFFQKPRRLFFPRHLRIKARGQPHLVFFPFEPFMRPAQRRFRGQQIFVRPRAPLPWLLPATSVAFSEALYRGRARTIRVRMPKRKLRPMHIQRVQSGQPPFSPALLRPWPIKKRQRQRIARIKHTAAVLVRVQMQQQLDVSITSRRKRARRPSIARVRPNLASIFPTSPLLAFETATQRRRTRSAQRRQSQRRLSRVIVPPQPPAAYPLGTVMRKRPTVPRAWIGRRPKPSSAIYPLTHSFRFPECLWHGRNRQPMRGVTRVRRRNAVSIFPPGPAVVPPALFLRRGPLSVPRAAIHHHRRDQVALSASAFLLFHPSLFRVRNRTALRSRVRVVARRGAAALFPPIAPAVFPDVLFRRTRRRRSLKTWRGMPSRWVRDFARFALDLSGAREWPAVHRGVEWDAALRRREWLAVERSTEWE